MRRTDAAGGEDIVELLPHLVDRRDDRLGDVGNDAHLAQPHADLVEPLGDERQIGVLGAARQDLVADDEETGGAILSIVMSGHLRASGGKRSAFPPSAGRTELSP